MRTKSRKCHLDYIFYGVALRDDHSMMTGFIKTNEIDVQTINYDFIVKF